VSDLRERLAALFYRRRTLGQSRADEAVEVVAAWLRDEAEKDRDLFRRLGEPHDLLFERLAGLADAIDPQPEGTTP